MAQPGGYDWVAHQFFARNYPALQVTPRRRKTATSTTNIATGVVQAVTVNVAMDAADALQPGDGILIDLFDVWVTQGQATNTTPAALLDVGFEMADSAGHVAPVGTAGDYGPPTLAAGLGGGWSGVPQSNTGVFMPIRCRFDEWNRLLTAPDLNFLLNGQLGGVIGNQPLLFQVGTVWRNTNAALQAVILQVVAFYRIVRGLQEG